MRSVEEIVALFDQRRLARSASVERMRSILSVYDGGEVLPVPQLDGVDIQATANLLAMGIDQHAMRIAVMPDIDSPAVKMGSPKAEGRAQSRRWAAHGWLERNEYPERVLSKRARWLVAYGSTPVVVQWRRDRQGRPDVRWSPRNPLTAFPAPETLDSAVEPRDCAFAGVRNVGWLRHYYPDLRDALNHVNVTTGYGGVRTTPLTDSDRLDLVEFYDDTETVLVVVGEGRYEGMITRQAEYGIGDAQIINLGGQPGNADRFAIELERVPNRTGLCPVVFPTRVSLGEVKGQFDDAVPLFLLQSVLQSLEVQAVANAIWPDTWLVARSSTEAPQIITPANGRKGIVGKVTGGDLKDIQVNPGYQTAPTANKLERDMRITTGIPADFGGEAATNVRTGVRGRNLLNESSGYYIRESQAFLARSIQHELKRAALTELANAPHRTRSFQVNWAGETVNTDYRPSAIFAESKTYLVSFDKAGQDPNDYAVNGGMRVNNGTMSHRTFMKGDPLIPDVDAEMAQMVSERLDEAILTGLQQGSVSGQRSAADIAAIKRLVRQGQSIEDAIDAYDQKLKEQQAAQPPPGSPEAQPGLAQPAGVPVTPAPPQGVKNGAEALRMLRVLSRGA